MNTITTRRRPFLFSILTSMLLAGTVAGAPKVRLELATEKGFAATESHRWMQALEGLDVLGLRIRAARSGERPRVEGEPGGTAPIRVIGLLGRDGRLRLPGGVFSVNDRVRIGAHLAQLAEGGVEQATAKPAAFGLAPKQLVELHDQLATQVGFPTAGQPAADVLEKLAESLPVSVHLDAKARAAIRTDEPVVDELGNLTTGTAIAAAVRPLGLVLVPGKSESNRGEVRLLITDVRSAKQSWPVGWPLEKNLRDTVPKLYEFLTVEIEDVALSDALDALQKRLDLPMLLDHNSLARQRIDPAQVKVTLPAGRTYYKKVLDRLLFQARLKAEPRVDEAGTPFLWITTIR